jgi:hypothetical protein
MEDQDINPYIYCHLIFDKGAKNIRWKKKTASSTKVLGNQDICM